MSKTMSIGSINFIRSIMEKEWFTAKEVARTFGVHPRTISRLCEEGKIHCVKFTRIYRIHRSELLKLIT